MKIGNILSLFQSAEEKKNLKLQEYMQSYHYQRGVELHNQGRDSDAFEELVSKLYEREGKVVILIDEYDKPILNNIQKI